MASLSSVPSMLEMAGLHANGFGVPILFPIYANGFAHVSSLHLSIKFFLHDGSIWVNCESYDLITSLLSLTMRENSIIAYNESSVWELGAGFTDSLNLGHTYPQTSGLLPIRSLPLWTPLLSFVSRLNPIFTLSYIFWFLWWWWARSVHSYSWAMVLRWGGGFGIRKMKGVNYMYNLLNGV